jgi:hypothetical protein
MSTSNEQLRLSLYIVKVLTSMPYRPRLSLYSDHVWPAVAVNWSNGLIMNGGFGYWLEHEIEDISDFKRAGWAYELLGFPQCCDAVMKVLALFGDEPLPKSGEERSRVVDAESGLAPMVVSEALDVMVRHDDEIAYALAAYIRRYEQEFRTDSAGR